MIDAFGWFTRPYVLNMTVLRQQSAAASIDYSHAVALKVHACLCNLATYWECFILMCKLKHIMSCEFACGAKLVYPVSVTMRATSGQAKVSEAILAM